MRLIFFITITLSLVFAPACSAPQIPQVEDARCTASRVTVQSFYSKHFADGEQIGFTRENVAKKEKFVTPKLYGFLLNELEHQAENARQNRKPIDEDILIHGDPFTLSMEYPAGFKIGGCSIKNDSEVTHTVQLFWSKEDKPINRSIQVETELSGERWLIRNILIDDYESLMYFLGGDR